MMSWKKMIDRIECMRTCPVHNYSKTLRLGIRQAGSDSTGANELAGALPTIGLDQNHSPSTPCLLFVERAVQTTMLLPPP
jgi:hypothetical protein